MSDNVVAGLTETTEFMHDALELQGSRFTAYMREQYKNCMQRFTSMEHSAASQEATQRLLNSQLGQIVVDVAASRRLTTQQVSRPSGHSTCPLCKT